MTTITISTIPTLADAVALGYTVDDSGNALTIDSALAPYDHNGNPDDHAYTYRLWTADLSRGVAVDVHADRDVVRSLDADGNTVESATGAVWVMLMNPVSGSVDTVANWRAEMSKWETSADGKTPQQQFAALIPVRLVDGEWVEA